MEYGSFDRETFKSFKQLDNCRSLHMLDLAKLKEKIVYPDGSVMTGVAASKQKD